MQEDQRLEILHSLKVLDTPPDQRFERIVEDAKRVFDVPIVLVSLVDRDRQWFKACLGLPERQTSRSLSFCSIAIEEGAPLIICDATLDPRVKENALVLGDPHIRFYAGFPLQVRGAYLGTLCIIDTRPREFDETQQRMLASFGHWAQAELEQLELGRLARDLELSQRRYQTLFRTSAQAVAIFSVQGQYIEGNALAQALWGKEWGGSARDGGSRGAPSLHDLRLEAPLGEAFEQASAGFTAVVEPFAYERGNGQKTFLQAVLTPLEYLGHCSGVILTIDDVTVSVLEAERQAELELKTLHEKEELDRARARRDAFVAVLAHEMRNPLNGILGLSEVLRARAHPEDREAAESIHACAETLSYLIDDTLDMERIQQGRLELDDAVFDLGALISSVLLTAQSSARCRSITLISTSRAPLGFVRGDQQRVRQILSNYVNNAVKYSSEGSQVQISCNASQLGFLFEVVDRGVGIAPEALETVFEPFYQVKRTATNSQRGLGLGLNIVKSLVEVMGGTLGVESQLGQGSRFWADLPLKPAQAESTATEGLARTISGRILVVDDNPINRRILSLQVTGMGATSEQAENGQEALDILAEREFDLVLMDCHMPVLDGFAASRAIKFSPERYGRPIVVALTAATSEQARQDCRKAGMDDFLAKPIRNIDLNAKLYTLLEERLQTAP